MPAGTDREDEMNLHTPLIVTRIAACIATAAMATSAVAQTGIQLSLIHI